MKHDKTLACKPINLDSYGLIGFFEPVPSEAMKRITFKGVLENNTIYIMVNFTCWIRPNMCDTREGLSETFKFRLGETSMIYIDNNLEPTTITSEELISGDTLKSRVPHKYIIIDLSLGVIIFYPFTSVVLYLKPTRHRIFGGQCVAST